MSIGWKMGKQSKKINNNKTKDIVINALFIAIIFVAAKIINIPTAYGGVINMADSVILSLSLVSTLQMATFNSAAAPFLAELFSPYAIYAPATLIIKGLMGFISHFIFYKTSFKSQQLRMIISFTCAELIMIIGYFIYQAYILQFGVIIAGLDIINNLIQASVSILAATIISNILLKYTSGNTQ